MRPVYYTRIEVNVYGGFVFMYSLQLDQVLGAWVGIDFHNDQIVAQADKGEAILKFSLTWAN